MTQSTIPFGSFFERPNLIESHAFKCKLHTNLRQKETDKKNHFTTSKDYDVYMTSDTTCPYERSTKCLYSINTLGTEHLRTSSRISSGHTFHDTFDEIESLRSTFIHQTRKEPTYFYGSKNAENQAPKTKLIFTFLQKRLTIRITQQSRCRFSYFRIH